MVFEMGTPNSWGNLGQACNNLSLVRLKAGHPVILRVHFIVLFHVKEIGDVMVRFFFFKSSCLGLMMCQAATGRLTGIMLIT